MSRVHTAHMPRFSKTRLPELTKARLVYREMIESGMWNIANEVGDAKIKDPYTKYTSGDKEGGSLCRRIMV